MVLSRQYLHRMEVYLSPLVDPRKRAFLLAFFVLRLLTDSDFCSRL